MSERSPLKGRISAEEKAQKRAAALRENLKKRKTQGQDALGTMQGARKTAPPAPQDGQAEE